MVNKEVYVHDVLEILEKRAEDEANLIFARYHKNNGEKLYTDISRDISTEINDHYAGLFSFFQTNPKLAEQGLFQRVILNHMPAFIRDSQKYRKRVQDIPAKITYAILASEVASHIVYRGGWEMDFESRLHQYLKEQFNEASRSRPPEKDGIE